MSKHTVLLLARFFSVRLQCSFPCLTAEIFSFMTDTKQNTIYKWPDLLWISVDVLFWKTLKEVTACKLFSAYRPSESRPGSWGHCQSSAAEQGAWQTGGNERNSLVQLPAYLASIGVLRWQGALQPGSAHGHRTGAAAGGIQCTHTRLQSASHSRKGSVKVDCTPQELLLGSHSDCALITSVIQMEAVRVEATALVWGSQELLRFLPGTAVWMARASAVGWMLW